MTLAVDDLMDHLNADSDELDYVTQCLNHAKSIVALLLQNDDITFDSNKSLDIDNAVDRMVEEYATNLYLERDGSTKTATKNISSLGVLVNYLREPSM